MSNFLQFGFIPVLLSSKLAFFFCNWLLKRKIFSQVIFLNTFYFFYVIGSVNIQSFIKISVKFALFHSCHIFLADDSLTAFFFFFFSFKHANISQKSLKLVILKDRFTDYRIYYDIFPLSEAFSQTISTILITICDICKILIFPLITDNFFPFFKSNNRYTYF